MTSETLLMKPEEQVEFFLPALEAYVEKLIQAFSQSKNGDFSEAVWQLILEDGKIGKFLNQHILLNCWEQMTLFFKKESKFYGFIDGKQKGLTEMEYKIWLFFSPNTANDFFKHQIDRPKGFSTANIITLPFVQLLEPFTEKLDGILDNKDLGVNQKMRKALEALDLAEWFLDEADFTIFDSQFKKAIAGVALLEAAALIKDIRNPSASASLLEKRLVCLHNIAWRYFRAKNELESKYFKKLLLKEPDEVEKGLKLTSKKVSDYKKSLQ